VWLATLCDTLPISIPVKILRPFTRAGNSTKLRPIKNGLWSGHIPRSAIENRLSMVFLNKYRLAAGCAAAVLLAAAPAAAQSAPGQDKVFDALAKTLIVQIDKSTARQRAGGGQPDAAADWLRKTFQSRNGKKPRIAIWPFDKDKIRIAVAIAGEYNARLRARMIHRAGERYQFVAPAVMADTVAALRKFGVLGDKDENAIAALFDAKLRADILVRGNLRKSGQELFLSYAAVKMTGELAGETAPVQVRVLGQDLGNVIPIDAAIDQAARAFRDLAFDMTELRIGGISFEDTGFKPPAGAFLERRLADALANEFANPLTGRKLTVKPLAVGKALSGGKKISAKALRDDTSNASAASYVLKGDYWDMGKALEIRVNLANGLGQTVSWKGRVAKADFANVEIYPKSRPGPRPGYAGLGPISLQLTSDRGKNPRYRIGDKMHLKIRLDRDAWLYCFYRQADGDMIQMLPNRFTRQKLITPKFAAGVLHTIPGEEIFPFNFDISAPAGSEKVRCFATSRDVLRDLPTGLRGRSFDPIGPKTQARLSRIFRQIPGAAVSESSLSVTVIDRR
jgi:hypothetical protein